MESLLYYTILNLPPEAGIADIKKAYYRLAKENHPDHFPQELREIQELKMMQINEAYHYLANLCSMKDKEPEKQTGAERKEKNKKRYDYSWNEHIRKRYENLSPVKDLGEPREPAYAYYKQGFVNFSKGLRGIMSRSSKRYLTDAVSLLEWANNSIKHFQRAHTYFTRVVSEYPDSIWYTDAREKLNRIQNFNMLYIKILNNIKARFDRGKL